MNVAKNENFLPPPDNFKISSEVTIETVSSSHLNHSSAQKNLITCM